MSDYPHITPAEIENWFTYHAPTAGQLAIYESLRAAGRQLAHVINSSAPDSQEKWQAIFSLRQTIMWANAAIACNPLEADNGDHTRPES